MHVASCTLYCIMLYTFPDSQEHMAIVLVTRHERLWGKEDVKNFGLEQLKFHQQVRLGMDSWTLLHEVFRCFANHFPITKFCADGSEMMKIECSIFL